MSVQIQKSERATAKTFLEILVIRVAGQWFGLRSDRQIHLRNFEAGKLIKSDDPALAELSGLLGELENLRLPIFDLAYLLELPASPSASPASQLVQLNLSGRAFGFAIEQAQEIQRVPLNELKQLPPIIKQLRSRPAIWAVWQRPSKELIPLLDFSFVLDKPAKQALQLGQG